MLYTFIKNTKSLHLYAFFVEDILPKFLLSTVHVIIWWLYEDPYCEFLPCLVLPRYGQWTSLPESPSYALKLRKTPRTRSCQWVRFTLSSIVPALECSVPGWACPIILLPRQPCQLLPGGQAFTCNRVGFNLEKPIAWKSRHWQVKLKPNILLSCLYMVINIKEKNKAGKEKEVLGERGHVLQFKLRYSGRPHWCCSFKPWTRQRSYAVIWENTPGKGCRRAKALRWCVPVCLRLSKWGESSLGKGQGVRVGATHILQGSCNDLYLNDLYVKCSDSNTLKNTNYRHNRFYSKQVATVEKAWILRLNAPKLKLQLYHLLDGCPQASDLTSQPRWVTWITVYLTGRAWWPREKCK